MVPRSWVSRACLLLVPIVATGCALVSDSDPESSSSSSESPSHSEAGGQAFPVTIDHKFGSTTITEKPVRVVTVGLNEQDALLALGVVPVGTTHWFGDEPGDIFPWARDALGDAPVPKVLDSEQEFESVAALEPDLIVAMYAGISKDDYRLLSQIAPTLAQPKGYVNYGVPWQETTRTVGLALGQADEADKLVDDVEALIASQRDAHPEFAGSTAVVATLYEGIFVYGPEDPRGRLLTDLGFTFPEELTDVGQDEFGGSISVENADLVDVDSLVWISAKQAVEKAVPQYGNLDVAKQGRDVFIDEDDPRYAATSFVTVLSLPYLLEDLVPRLEAAVDADVTTETS